MPLHGMVTNLTCRSGMHADHLTQHSCPSKQCHDPH
jgi:hypothetical protein